MYLAARFVYYIFTVHVFKPYSGLTKFLSTNILLHLLFVVFSNKIYAPVSFKTVLKNLLIKNFVKQEYGFKMWI